MKIKKARFKLIALIGIHPCPAVFIRSCFVFGVPPLQFSQAGRLTQRLEYLAYTEGVRGSNPLSPMPPSLTIS